MHIYTLKIDQSMPSLKTLCRQAIITKVLGESEEGNVEVLPLPTREISRLTMMREPLIPVSAVGVVSLLTTPMLVYRYNIKKIEAILCYQNTFLLSTSISSYRDQFPYYGQAYMGGHYNISKQASLYLIIIKLLFLSCTYKYLIHVTCYRSCTYKHLIHVTCYRSCTYKYLIHVTCYRSCTYKCLIHVTCYRSCTYKYLIHVTCYRSCTYKYLIHVTCYRSCTYKYLIHVTCYRSCTYKYLIHVTCYRSCTYKYLIHVTCYRSPLTSVAQTSSLNSMNQFLQIAKSIVCLNPLTMATPSS